MYSMLTVTSTKSKMMEKFVGNNGTLSLLLLRGYLTSTILLSETVLRYFKIKYGLNFSSYRSLLKELNSKIKVKTPFHVKDDFLNYKLNSKELRKFVIYEENGCLDEFLVRRKK